MSPQVILWLATVFIRSCFQEKTESENITGNTQRWDLAKMAETWKHWAEFLRSICTQHAKMGFKLARKAATIQRSVTLLLDTPPFNHFVCIVFSLCKGCWSWFSWTAVSQLYDFQNVVPREQIGTYPFWVHNPNTPLRKSILSATEISVSGIFRLES